LKLKNVFKVFFSFKFETKKCIAAAAEAAVRDKKLASKSRGAISCLIHIENSSKDRKIRTDRKT
jgi:hypothetical protein